MRASSLAETQRRTALFALGLVLGCGPAGEPRVTPRRVERVQQVPPPVAAVESEPASVFSRPERHTAGDVRSARPFIGVELRKQAEGVVVAYTHPGGPAASAGLRAGDVLRRIDGQPIEQVVDVTIALEAVAIGASASVVVARAGRQRLFRVGVQPQPTREELLSSIYVGQPAPSISSLQPLTGAVVPSLEQLRGRVVVLEFWASFCTACRALSPELNRWSRENEVLGLRVLGITMDPPDVALDAAQYFQIEYSVHFDEDGAVTRAYRGTALPSVFLVDQHGVVRDVVVGLYPDRLAALHDLAEQLLRAAP